MDYQFASRISASLAADDREEMTEVDAGWFDSLGQKAQQAYIRLHPNSKFARYYRRQIKHAPTDITKIEPTQENLDAMHKHLKDLEYGKKYGKSDQERKAFATQHGKMLDMIKKHKDRMDDAYFEKKQAKKEQRQRVKQRLKERPARMAGWKNSSQDVEEPDDGDFDDKQQEVKQPEPSKPQYTPEQLERLKRGGGMASDFVPDKEVPSWNPESGKPAPGHGPKPTKVVKRKPKVFGE